MSSETTGPQVRNFRAHLNAPVDDEPWIDVGFEIDVTADKRTQPLGVAELVGRVERDTDAVERHVRWIAIGLRTPTPSTLRAHFDYVLQHVNLREMEDVALKLLDAHPFSAAADIVETESGEAVDPEAWDQAIENAKP